MKMVPRIEPRNAIRKNHEPISQKHQRPGEIVDSAAPDEPAAEDPTLFVLALRKIEVQLPGRAVVPGQRSDGLFCTVLVPQPSKSAGSTKLWNQKIEVGGRDGEITQRVAGTRIAITIPVIDSVLTAGQQLEQPAVFGERQIGGLIQG